MHLLKILLSWHAVAPNYTVVHVFGRQDLSAVKALNVMAEPLNSQDLSSNSPYCLPCSSCTCNVSLENLVLDQLIIL